MKNLIKKLNLKKKSSAAIILIGVFILIVGTTVYAWPNNTAETTNQNSNILGDNLTPDLSAPQLTVRDLLAKKLNHDPKDVSIVISEESETTLVGLAAFDSPSRTEAVNFKAQKINGRWLITEIQNNFY